MDTLKPNMYVRTLNGIVKIDEVIENGVITYEDDFGREWEEQTGRKVIRYISNDGWNCGLDENDILKASYNIIDLIEEGDYVNGYKVLNVLDFIDNSKMLSLEKIYDSNIANEDIKSIVTKEVFKSMEYRLGDK